ncbi:MAG: hypothetical protein ACYDCN_04825 [Bacteroidia bacterium]
MATQNLVSATISPADKTNIQTHLTAIKTLLPFLIALTPRERKEGLKLGNKTVAFVEDAITYAIANPLLVPAYVNITEIQKDLALQKDLIEVIQWFNGLHKTIEDTKQEAGAEAYSGILGFYQAVKIAAEKDVPIAKAIYADLSKRYPGRKPKVIPTPTPTPPKPTPPPTGAPTT